MRRYVGYGYGYYRCYFASGLFAAHNGLSGIFRRSAVGADGTRGRLWAAAGSLFVKGVRIWLSL